MTVETKNFVGRFYKRLKSENRSREKDISSGTGNIRKECWELEIKDAYA